MNRIKRRLQTAYENVEYFADSTWTSNDDLYQKANQELHTRSSKVRDFLTDEVVRPRTVRESIPNSRLAQYANFEYNEARELSYASSASNVSFYYPCLYKNGCITEPWMIPEIEHMLIWFTYSPDYGFAEILDREELNQLEEFGKLDLVHTPTCYWNNYHQVFPAFSQTLEKTPGYTRYTKSPPMTLVDFCKYEPTLLKAHTFEEMTLRMKITSDKVKYLWSKESLSHFNSPRNITHLCMQRPSGVKHKAPKSVKKINENVYDDKKSVEIFEETNTCESSNQPLENIVETYSQPKTLLNKRVPISVTKDEEISHHKEAAPTRRLYSAVLQGISTNSPKQLSSTDMKSPVSVTTKKNSRSQTNISPVKSEKSATDGKISLSVTKKTVQEPIHAVLKEKRPMSNTAEENVQNTSPAMFCSVQPSISCNITPQNSNLINISTSTTSYTNLTSAPHLGNGFVNNTCINSMCVGNNYLNVNAQYTNYHNNMFCSNLYPNCTYQSSQVVPPNSRCTVTQNSNRQLYPQSHSVWYVNQHNKTPNMYMQSHYVPQPYYVMAPPSQPQTYRQNQRWSHQASYSGQSSSFQQTQSFQNLSQAHWGVQNQNLFRSTSTQHISQQFSDYTQSSRLKARCKKGHFENNIFYNEEKLCNLSQRSSSSSDVVFSGPVEQKQTVRSSISTSSVELKANKKLEKSAPIITIQARIDNSTCALPIVSTVSEELERQALEQYQPSEEAVYRELERQAEEQYEDDSENWISPPNDDMVFGGHIVCNIVIEQFLILFWYL